LLSSGGSAPAPRDIWATMKEARGLSSWPKYPRGESPSGDGGQTAPLLRCGPGRAVPPGFRSVAGTLRAGGGVQPDFHLGAGRCVIFGLPIAVIVPFDFIDIGQIRA